MTYFINKILIALVILSIGYGLIKLWSFGSENESEDNDDSLDKKESWDDF